MSYLKINMHLTKRGFFVLLIPYLTASIWYYLFSSQMIEQVLERVGAIFWFDWANICFYFSIVFSIFVGSFYVDKVDKIRLIYLWATIMPIAMILLAFTRNLICIFGLFFLLGWVFGIGLLAYSVYFCRLTNTEERGRASGAIVFLTLLSSPMILSLGFDFSMTITTCIFLGLCTFLIHLFKPRERVGLTTKKRLSAYQSKSTRTLLLYLIPWLVFCIINTTSARIVFTYMSYQFSEVLFQAQVVQYLAASFGALAGGIFADWAGRKVTLGIGLVSYGVGTALTGLASTPEVSILSAFPSGFSWGVLLVVYTLVVWGDIASTKKCARFYAAGLLPFYFCMGLGYLVAPEILGITAMHAALLSAFLIFLSNVPIILAEELMPQDIVKEMNLRWYTNWLKRFLKKQKKETKR